jgi:RNA polymerase sigma factor (TIGR02999 family)
MHSERQPPRDAAVDVTGLLQAWGAGDAGAGEHVLPAIYDALRAQAARVMRQEGSGHTLQPTALVHEAYLRMVDQRRAEWRDRVHFLSVAAHVMRRVLVDHARRRHAAKRGGPAPLLALGDLDPPDGRRVAAGRRPARRARRARTARGPRPEQARLVELRYFAGLTIEEAPPRSACRPRRSSASGRSRGAGCGASWGRVTPERWREVKAVVGEALDRPTDERAALLARACADDGALRREVESLLANACGGTELDSLPAVRAAIAAEAAVVGARGSADGDSVLRPLLEARSAGSTTSCGRSGVAAWARCTSPGSVRSTGPWPSRSCGRTSPRRAPAASGSGARRASSPSSRTPASSRSTASARYAASGTS